MLTRSTKRTVTRTALEAPESEVQKVEEMQKEYVLNILGSEWTMRVRKSEDESCLKNADGVTDRSTKTMYIRADQDGVDNPLEDYTRYQKEVKRHEIIHAFLFESGLGNETYHPEYGHDEQIVSWFAIQFPKLQKAFEQADAL